MTEFLIYAVSFLQEYLLAKLTLPGLGLSQLFSRLLKLILSSF